VLVNHLFTCDIVPFCHNIDEIGKILIPKSYLNRKMPIKNAKYVSDPNIEKCHLKNVSVVFNNGINNIFSYYFEIGLCVSVFVFEIVFDCC